MPTLDACRPVLRSINIVQSSHHTLPTFQRTHNFKYGIEASWTFNVSRFRHTLQDENVSVVVSPNTQVIVHIRDIEPTLGIEDF